MPWNDGGDKPGPWGSGGGNRNNNFGPQPNIEDLIKKGQDKFKNMMPGGFGNMNGIFVILGLALVIWLGSGFYKLREGEQAAVLRFGQWVGTTNAGLRYHWPYPIEKVLIRKVTLVNRINSSEAIDFVASNLRDVQSKDSMLTGDENIVEVGYTVFWFIKDLGKYLFNAEDPDEAIKIAADSTMREIVAKTPIVDVITKGRGSIDKEAQTRLQKLADEYGLGIEIKEVQLQKTDPHASVLDAFKDVQRAKTDMETKINAAESYKNQVVPVAEGAAARVIQEAEAYKTVTVARAEGDSSRFDAVWDQYKQDPGVTRTRIYTDTMTKIFADANKVFLGSGTKGAGGVLPYMALPGVKEPAAEKKDEEVKKS